MTFTPMQLPSRSQAYDRRRAEQEQNNRPFEQQQAYVNRQKAIEAEKAGQDLKAIASLAPTAKALMMHQDEKADKKAKIRANELWWKSRQGLPPEQRQDPVYLEKLKEFNENINRYSKLAQEAQANGASWDVVNEINNLSGKTARHYGIKHLQSATTGLEAYLTQGMSRDDIDITIGTGDDKITFTPRDAQGVNQKMAAQQELWELYQEENGLDAYRPGFLGDHYYEKAFEIKDKVANTIRVGEWKSKSAVKQQEILSDFGTDKKYSTAFNALKNQLDTKSEGAVYLNNSQIHGILDKEIESLAEAGLITEDDINEIANEKSHIKKKEGGYKTMGEAYPAKIENWKSKIKEAAKDRAERNNDIRKTKAAELEFNYMETWTENYFSKGLHVPEEELQKARNAHFLLTGEDEPQWIKDIYTRQEAADDDARDFLNKKYKQEGLTKQDLAPYSPTIYKEFAGLVNESSAYMNIPEKDLAGWEKRVNGHARTAAGLDGSLGTNDLALEIDQNAQRHFRELVKDNIVNKGLPQDQAMKLAYEEVRDNFKLDRQDGGQVGDYYLDKAFDLNQIKQASTDRQNTIDALEEDPDVTQIPKGSKPYIQNARDYRDGKKGVKLDPYFHIVTLMNPNLTAEGLADKLLQLYDGPENGLYGSKYKGTPRFIKKEAVDDAKKVFDISRHEKHSTLATRAQLIASIDDYSALIFGNNKDGDSESYFNSPTLLKDWSA